MLHLEDSHRISVIKDKLIRWKKQKTQAGNLK